jgi:hypothetical protein
MKRFSVIIFSLAILAIFCLVAAGGISSAQQPGIDKTFRMQGSGYTIGYPSTWEYAAAGPDRIVFGGSREKGTLGSAVGIRNVNSTKVQGGKYKDMDALTGDLLDQLKAAEVKDVKVYPTETYIYEREGVSVTGKQFLVEYNYQGGTYKQWFVIVPRPAGDVFHLWYYVAPLAQYDRDLGTAKAMLASWALDK